MGRFFTEQYEWSCLKMTTNIIYNHTDLLIDGIFQFNIIKINKTRNDLVFEASVCVTVSLRYEKLNEGRKSAQSQSVRERNGQSKTCFLYYCDDQTAVQRHSGNRQRHKSLYTATPSETARVSKEQYATKSVFNGYIVGVYWFLLHPCTCVILDGTTGNHTFTISPWNVVIRSSSNSAVLLINI